MLANQRGQGIERLGFLQSTAGRKRRPASMRAQIVEDATAESGGVERSVQVRSPHRTIGRHDAIKAVRGFPAFADDPEPRLSGLSALRLPHVNLVANNFLLLIEAQCPDLLSGFFRLKGGGSFQEAQPFHCGRARFNLHGVEQLPAQHLIATANSHNGSARCVAMTDIISQPRRSQVGKVSHGAFGPRNDEQVGKEFAGRRRLREVAQADVGLKFDAFKVRGVRNMRQKNDLDLKLCGVRCPMAPSIWNREFRPPPPPRDP